MTNSVDFTQEFPVIAKYNYLNTAASGLLPKCVAEWRRKHDEAFVEQGSLFRDNHKELIWSVKRDVARFLDADAQEVALIPNFSFGLNSLLEGIPKGKRILLIDGDYPSINWPVEYRDFEIQHVTLNEHLESNLEEAFERFNPDYFICSLVQYINGIRLDLEFLGSLKKQFPETILIGDGTQFFGTAEYSFKKGPFDIIGASAYKWLLAGYGNGFMIMRPEVEHAIMPKSIGFNSADAVFGKKEEINMVGRLEPGHQDTLNYGSLGRAIQLLETIGMEAIEKKVSTLAAQAHQTFAELGWLTPNVSNRKLHSSIFNIRGTEALFLDLKTHGVITSPRGPGIRVSFHFYNTQEDLDALIERVQAFDR